MLDYTPESHAVADQHTDELRDLVFQGASDPGSLTIDAALSVALTAYAAGHTKASEPAKRAHMPHEIRVQAPLLRETVRMLDDLVFAGKAQYDDVSTHRNAVAEGLSFMLSQHRALAKKAIDGQFGPFVADICMRSGPASDSDLLEAGTEIRSMHTGVFHAFVSQHKRPHDCRCPTCYSNGYRESTDQPADIPRLMVEHFGSAIGATKAFASWYIDALRAQIPERVDTSGEETLVQFTSEHSDLLSGLVARARRKD